MKSSLKSFFEYFESTWVFSKESLWYEGANEEVVRSAPTKRALSTDLDDDESVMVVLPRRSKRVKNAK